MYLEIDIKMNINHNFSDFTEINDGPNKLLIIGNFLSIFKDKKFLTKEESLKILEKSLKDLDNLKKYPAILPGGYYADKPFDLAPNKSYPLRWLEVAGEHFHPLMLKYSQHIKFGLPDALSKRYK